jgi:voltage-gated potassium channel
MDECDRVARLGTGICRKINPCVSGGQNGLCFLVFLVIVAYLVQENWPASADPKHAVVVFGGAWVSGWASSPLRSLHPGRGCQFVLGSDDGGVPRPVIPASTLRQRVRSARTRLIGAMLVPFVVMMFGAVGYSLIEHWSFLDSLFMATITISTVGYGEIHTLSPSGRVFTIILVVISLGSVGYALSAIGRFMLEGELREIILGRRMDKAIAALQDHVIVCGMGRTGRSVIEELREGGTPCVALDRSPEVIADVVEKTGVPGLAGDATSDDILEQAGIARAKGLVAVLHDDPDNVFVVLSARSLRPDLSIIARLNDERNHAKLLKAGANEIVSPNAIGGVRMASLLVRRHVVDFFDEVLSGRGDWTLENVQADSIAGLSGRTMAEADLGRRFGILVLGIRHPDGAYTVRPAGTLRINATDTLVVLAHPADVIKLTSA